MRDTDDSMPRGARAAAGGCGRRSCCAHAEGDSGGKPASAQAEADFVAPIRALGIVTGRLGPTYAAETNGVFGCWLLLT